MRREITRAFREYGKLGITAEYHLRSQEEAID